MFSRKPAPSSLCTSIAHPIVLWTISSTSCVSELVTRVNITAIPPFLLRASSCFFVPSCSRWSLEVTRAVERLDAQPAPVSTELDLPVPVGPEHAGAGGVQAIDDGPYRVTVRVGAADADQRDGGVKALQERRRTRGRAPVV